MSHRLLAWRHPKINNQLSVILALLWNRQVFLPRIPNEGAEGELEVGTVTGWGWGQMDGVGGLGRGSKEALVVLHSWTLNTG